MRASRGLQLNCFSFDLLASVRASLSQPSRGHGMHRASELVLYVVLQPDLLEQRAPPAQVDEHIKIAVRTCVAAGDRPEDRYRPCTVTCCEMLDLTVAPTEFFQRWRRPGRTRVPIRAAAALNLTAALGELVQGPVLLLGRDRHRWERKASSGSRA